jgi:putative ABC transport system ATP-binding protein
VVVLEALERANRELGATTALITHNVTIGAIADRVIHLADGRITRVEENARKRTARELSW